MKIGAITGSFDPITKGHVYVIEEALRLVDKLVILIAYNPEKKYTFSYDERAELIIEAIKKNTAINFTEKYITFKHLPPNKFAAEAAFEEGATVIFRGLRNVVDFEYEHSLQLINCNISPGVSTVFVMPPAELIAVSSSAIKGMVGLDNWEKVAIRYVNLHVITALNEKHLVSIEKKV
jgi:pantetheine-phosphate adenylyltransferase